jgi:hypothetical protein
VQRDAADRDVPRRCLGERGPTVLIEAGDCVRNGFVRLDEPLQNALPRLRAFCFDPTGSKSVRKRVGSPLRPALIEKAQNWFVVTRCVTTSCTDQPSHRVGDAHCASSRFASVAASRRRWRSSGTEGSSSGASKRK